MRILVYEDSGWQQFLPLVYMRAVFQLVCGMGDLLARVLTLSAGCGRAKAAPALWCRRGLAEVVAANTGLETNQPLAGSALLLNGRGLWTRLPSVSPGDPAWIGTVGSLERVACVFADAALAARLSPELLLDREKSSALLHALPRRDVSADVTLLEWPWEIVRALKEALAEDWIHRDGRGAILGEVDRSSHVLGAEAVHIGEGTQLKPCAVIDAGKGPVWIGRKAEILPHAYVEGPAFIGDGCRLQPGAVVRASFIGPVCRIGGEVEGSIVQSYSNKQHHGFLGHGYVGSWVNLAAGCVSGDLKNTYGSVRVPVNGREVDSGEQFVGTFVGDHSKIGTNVAFPPGSVVGFCSSVATSPIPKFVPSFSWIDGDGRERYAGDRGLEVARKAMARRGKEMGAAAERVFLEVGRQARELEYVEEL